MGYRSIFGTEERPERDGRVGVEVKHVDGRPLPPLAARQFFEPVVVRGDFSKTSWRYLKFAAIIPNPVRQSCLS